jgi:hypothetical protein
MADRSLIWRSRERRILVCAGSLFLIGIMGSIRAPYATSSNEVAQGPGRWGKLASGRDVASSKGSIAAVVRQFTTP